MQWAALNDPAHRDGDAPGRSKAVTSEAEESRLTSKYESALLHIRAGEREAAVGELGAILEHPMMSEPPTHLRRPTVSVPGGVSLTPTMTQIKFLSLKTLGRLVAELADERHAASDPSASASESESYALALRCYAAAVEIDGADSALWRRLGALAVRRGQPHVARHALEMGLALHPRNPLMLEDLAECLLAVGDFPACKHVAGLVAALDPRNARAMDMKRRPESLDVRATPDETRASLSPPPAPRDPAAPPEPKRPRAGSPPGPDRVEVTLRLRRNSWDAVAEALARAMERYRGRNDDGDEEEEEEASALLGGRVRFEYVDGGREPQATRAGDADDAGRGAEPQNASIDEGNDGRAEDAPRSGAGASAPPRLRP